jgi:GAF domain-containing protein
MRQGHDDGRHGALLALAGVALGDTTLEAVLARTCEIGKAAVPGAHEVSVTLVEKGAPRTAAHTGDIALAADRTQYAVGAGPCLEAASTGQPVVVNDLRAESRWPDYVPAARHVGVQGSLSVPLRVDDDLVGALNIYSVEPDAFDPDAIDAAVDLARYAGIVLTNADLYRRATTKVEQMQAAMQSRAVIEQAKGILMWQRRCTADEAFEVLVRLSQESHRKLREVAELIVHQVTED